jgi:hypothetical protein
MYLIPGNTLAGDLICVFPQTDIIAMVRRPLSGKQGELVGRAVGLFEEPTTSPLFGQKQYVSWREFTSQYSNKGFYGASWGSGFPVDLKLNIGTLQLLTRGSYRREGRPTSPSVHLK